jgi:hypothetical protein
LNDPSYASENASGGTAVTNLERPTPEADIAEVARLVSQGRRVTDPELRCRIRERSDALRQEMLRTQGLTNVAVDLVREIRDSGS